MAVDLHLHSTKSDGSDEPADVVRLAAEAGLTTIALTDHDNLDGVAEARAAADAAAIGLIPGTELSVDWEDAAMHMLVYFLEPGSGPLQDELETIRQGRANRNHVIVERLNDLGVDITYDEVATEAGDGVVGRPHIAAVLLRGGHVETIQEAFDRFLATGRPAYVDRLRLEARNAIELARRSGAVPVIAHPHTVGVSAEDYRRAFTSLVDAGLGGIEAYYSEYSPDQRAHIARLCKQLGIAATGGTDYHGTYKPGMRVGVGRGDLVVPESAVEDLLEARLA